VFLAERKLIPQENPGKTLQAKTQPKRAKTPRKTTKTRRFTPQFHEGVQPELFLSLTS
jgi:hypothetical protein